MTSQRGRRRPLFPSVARGLALGVGLAAAANARRWVDVVEVRGASMAPTLLPGDWLVVERRTYGGRSPRVGEIVLAPDPREPSRELIKRVARVDDEAGSLELHGDAADASTDSRSFGSVPIGAVTWRAVGRYWPPERAGRIRTGSSRPRSDAPGVRSVPDTGEGTTMPQAQRSVTIHRSPEVVFAYLADGETCAEWRPGVLDIARVSGEGVGTVYRQGVRGPMGRRVAADYAITSYEPNRLIEFQTIAGPIRPQGTYELEALDDGTRVNFSLQTEMSWLQNLFMRSAVTKTMESEMRALDTVKQILEGGAPPVRTADPAT